MGVARTKHLPHVIPEEVELRYLRLVVEDERVGELSRPFSGDAVAAKAGRSV